MGWEGFRSNLRTFTVFLNSLLLGSSLKRKRGGHSGLAPPMIAMSGACPPLVLLVLAVVLLLSSGHAGQIVSSSCPPGACGSCPPVVLFLSCAPFLPSWCPPNPLFAACSQSSSRCHCPVEALSVLLAGFCVSCLAGPSSGLFVCPVCPFCRPLYHSLVWAFSAAWPRRCRCSHHQFEFKELTFKNHADTVRVLCWHSMELFLSFGTQRTQSRRGPAGLWYPPCNNHGSGVDNPL